MKRTCNLFGWAFFFCCMLAWGLPCRMQGAPVSIGEARNTAAAFWKKVSPSSPAPVFTPHKRLVRPEPAAYYVFDSGDGSGFVIVSGDDRTSPILGYVTAGKFDEDRLPDGLRGLLESYEHQLASLPEDATAPATVASVGEKLLVTADWNQRKPFNMECPDRTLTGCVATAMGIIMRFHSWPERGQGTHSYEWIPAVGEMSRTLSADFGNTVYEWDNMPLDFSEYTDRQAQAVSTLLYHAGVSVDMDYGIDASGADFSKAWRAMVNNFRYSPTSRLYSADDYEAAQWEEMLRAEIDGNRPVFYSGEGSGGHAFVLDGYKDNFFHFNWGWGGYCNGYFMLGSLNPAEGNYSDSQQAIFGLQPNYEGKVYSPLMISDRDGFSGMVSNHTSVKAGEEFFVDCSGLINTGQEKFTGRVLLVLRSADGQVKEVLASSYNPSYFSLPPNSYGGCEFKGRFSLDAADGDWICLMSRAEGESELLELLTETRERVTLPAVGHTPETFDVDLDYDEEIFSVSQCSGMSGTGSYGFYQGKPLMHGYYVVRISYFRPQADKVVVRVNGLSVPYSTRTENNNVYLYAHIANPVEEKYSISIRGYKDSDLIENVTLHLENPGTLAETVAAKGINMDVVSGMTLTGKVDVRDFAWLKDQLLERIDMGKTSVQAYGENEANAIPRSAFAYCYNLRRFVMPEGITKISNNAFMLTGLETITIPAGVEYIGLNVFFNCQSLSEVYVYNPEPVFINWCVLIGTLRDQGGTLHVPAGSKEKYAGYAEWRDFTNIIDDLPVVSVREVRVTEGEVPRIYDLSGRRMLHPRAGLYIVDGKKMWLK